MMKWYKKQSISIRAAIIGGGFVILAGIITGIIDAFIPNPTIIVQYAPTGVVVSTVSPTINETVIHTQTLEQILSTQSFDRAYYQELVDFAYSSSGVNLPSKSDASIWADANYDFFQKHNFELFKEIFIFAYSPFGINFSTKLEASQWALENVSFFETHEFNEFKELFNYAYSSSGLNMTSRIQAAEWALEKMGK